MRDDPLPAGMQPLTGDGEALGWCPSGVALGRK